MQTDITKLGSRKVLSVNLFQLNQIVNTYHIHKPTHKDTYFDFIVFVARFEKNGDKNIFTDQTQILYYEPKKFGPAITPIPGKYYQCFCTLKCYNTTFKPEIMNIAEVEGNSITAHMAKVIKEDLEISTIENHKQKNDLSTVTIEQIEKPEQIYERIKQWMKGKEQFTEQQLRSQFEKNNNRRIFSEFLTQLEDEAVIGNMGDHYQYIG